MSRVSVLYMQGVAHVAEMMYLVTGSGIPAVLNELEKSAIIRRENKQPEQFIAGIEESVQFLRTFHKI